jgi:hypothetical protein
MARLHEPFGIVLIVDVQCKMTRFNNIVMSNNTIMSVVSSTLPLARTSAPSPTSTEEKQKEAKVSPYVNTSHRAQSPISFFYGLDVFRLQDKR